jgi:acetyl-CoA carboxylase carboxyl transferase subunit alpha
MAQNYLEFEKPLAEIDKKIEELRLKTESGKDKSADIEKLMAKAAKVREELYSNLTPWQKTQVARHQDRPNMMDYVGRIMTDFMEMHGDRAFADDAAIIGGMAWFHGNPVVVIGHSKGRTMRDKVKCNFGMPHPEGYRKALRLMKYAERFKKPIITFIDTAGAYPGIGAEERGQSEAIARNLYEMSKLRIPIIAVVMGEGGSGGALALGVGNRVLMMEHAVYSVISPEGCAAILWKDGAKAPDAADILKLTAQDLTGMGIVDGIVPEPVGGAHRDPNAAAASLDDALVKHLEDLADMSPEGLAEDRYKKFRAIGMFDGG